MSDINDIEGSDGTRLGTLRESDEELDSALDTPISNPHKRNREMDVTIAEQLFDHGWGRDDIQRVLDNHNPRDGLSPKEDYFEIVVDDAESNNGEVN